MNRVTSTILLFVTFGITSSCDSGISPKDEFASKFHKEWVWIQTIGGIGGWDTTPEKSGKHFLLDFHKTDSVIIYRNDTLTYVGKYIIKNRENEDGKIDESRWVLSFDTDDPNLSKEAVSPALLDFYYEIIFESDTLAFYPILIDRYQSRFVLYH